MHVSYFAIQVFVFKSKCPLHIRHVKCNVVQYLIKEGYSKGYSSESFPINENILVVVFFSCTFSCILNRM